MKFKKGQHVVCKYHGDNGDLIVGRIESVRNNGDVLLTNLLTGARSVKKATVLVRRNKVVPKKEITELLTYYKRSSDKAETRKKAVLVANGPLVVLNHARTFTFPPKILWYAKGGGIRKAGPFATQILATNAIRLSDDRGFPADAFVWPEEGR